jgi:hypothetical protein
MSIFLTLKELMCLRWHEYTRLYVLCRHGVNESIFAVAVPPPLSHQQRLPVKASSPSDATRYVDTWAVG